MTQDLRAQMIALLPRLRSFARGLSGQHALADDLVQITVEKALRHLDSFDPGSRLDSWLFRILRNSFIDHVRARRETTSLDADDALPLIGTDGREVTETRLHLADVRRAMDRLPEDQRIVLMLVCVEGLRYREVAEALDLPQGTVMSRLSRARLALAQLLQDVDSPASSSAGTA
ncbi:RNA polymerase sigma factor [Paracoccus nototheniae]|uniref:RNA polymerase sigma factor n=1 Tax=Paracoccus nototheniae TaxID=2489002 RepID=A0ABW4DXD3_9RHOB|nr:RNA polymerase sigma factor [Paracoccus nototheniae]